MEIKFKSNIKEIKKHFDCYIKKIEKKIYAKKTEVVNMAFELLDDESEKYLMELLSYPNYYDIRFQIEENKGCKNSSVLQNLIDKGFLESSGIKYYLDNSGYYCSAKLTQKAKTYQTMKEKYLENTGEKMANLLDKESEEALRKLVEMDKGNYFPISKNDFALDIVKNLDKKGYIEVGSGGLQGFSVGGVAMIIVTRDGKNYWEMKEEYNNFHKQHIYAETYNDLRGADLSYSYNQVGNKNSNQNITITNELVDEILKEINENIERYGLSDDEKQELKDLVEDVNEKQQKKPNLLKRALQGIWNFAKDVGCNVLAAYISGKCGF